MTDKDVMRLGAAAQRMSAIPDWIDNSFMITAEGLVARYVFMNEAPPAASARQLVSAGLISPNDPLAVALQETDPASRTIPGPDSFQSFAADGAQHLSRSTPNRDVMISAAALRRRINQSQMTPVAIAVGFEEIARKAQSAGHPEAADFAAATFAKVTLCAVQNADTLQPRPKRVADLEMG